MTKDFCHSEERSDVGIRFFLRWTGVRAAESSAPTEGLPKSQQRADVGIGPYGWLQRAAAAARAALSEAESAERVAGQIRSLPDDLGVQHGVPCPEVSAKPRPCSRRGCVDWAELFRAASRCAAGRFAPVTAQRKAFFLLTAPPPFSFCRRKKKMGVESCRVSLAPPFPARWAGTIPQSACG